MRKLYIKRHKSFVACLANFKVYVEDEIYGDLVINNVNCRKLGDIKNNEEKVFEITEEPVRIYVIADKLSKGFCSEFYQLEEGENDVFLSGKPHFNPATGNAFRFDNNDNEEVKKNRTKGLKKGIIILCIAFLVGIIVGYGGGNSVFSNLNSREKVFSENGMTITLTNGFKEMEVENYTNCYDSKKVVVFSLKESFSLAPGFDKYTLTQYGELVLANNGLYSTELKNYDELLGFEYDRTNDETNDTYRYYTFVFKTDDAFWIVQFATKAKNAEKYEDKIIDWAKSVKFE